MVLIVRRMDTSIPRLPATYDDALAQQMRDYARARLDGAHWGQDERREANKLLLMEIALTSERHCAYVIHWATHGVLDAFEAASELLSSFLASGQPMGASLEHFGHWLTLDLRLSAPEGRPSDALLDYAIVLLIIDLRTRFPEANLYRSTRLRASVCAVVAGALREARLRNVTEGAIRKIYERVGPRGLPVFRQGPRPGVMRFLAGG
jgi:hypothetical protein